MHPLPPIDQLDQLGFCGNEIESISIGFNVVHFNLSGGGYIASLNGFEQVTAAGDFRYYDVQEKHGAPLWTDLLLKPIVRLTRDDDLRLTLELADGSKLTILSDVSPYESVHLSWGNDNFWVC